MDYIKEIMKLGLFSEEDIENYRIDHTRISDSFLRKNEKELAKLVSSIDEVNKRRKELYSIIKSAEKLYQQIEKVKKPDLRLLICKVLLYNKLQELIEQEEQIRPIDLLVKKNSVKKTINICKAEREIFLYGNRRG